MSLDAFGVGARTHFTAALAGTVTSVKASSGAILGWHFGSANAALGFVQIFDAAAADVTLGTTVPKLSIYYGATTPAFIALPKPIPFGTAISVAATTTAGGLTAASCAANVFFA